MRSWNFWVTVKETSKDTTYPFFWNHWRTLSNSPSKTFLLLNLFSKDCSRSSLKMVRTVDIWDSSSKETDIACFWKGCTFSSFFGSNKWISLGSMSSNFVSFLLSICISFYYWWHSKYTLKKVNVNTRFFIISAWKKIGFLYIFHRKFCIFLQNRNFNTLNIWRNGTSNTFREG